MAILRTIYLLSEQSDEQAHVILRIVSLMSAASSSDADAINWARDLDSIRKRVSTA